MSKSTAVVKTGLQKGMLQHPLANRLAPGGMDPEEFAGFVEDIKVRGQQVAITTFDGKILDGFHRYRALEELGILKDAIFNEYTGNDAPGLVLALNVLRRKLSASQRALAAARLVSDFGMTQDDACKRVGTAKAHVSLVGRALASNNARLIKDIEEHDLSRAVLQEQMYELGLVDSTATTRAASKAAAAAAAAPDEPEGDGDADLLGFGTSGLADLLDSASSNDAPRNNVVPITNSTAGKVPPRPQHPERKATKTAAQLVSEAFKALLDNEKADFLRMNWHTIQPIIAKQKLDVKNAQAFAVPSKRGRSAAAS